MFSFRTSRVAILAVFAVSLASCGGPTSTQSVVPTQAVGAKNHARPAVTSNYIYVTDRLLGELLVYPAYVPSPSPIRTVTSGLNVVEGVATDSSGNVYVANNPATGGPTPPEVIEYSSGATSVIRTFTSGLHHALDVAIGPGGNVYVTDQNGSSSKILEYAPSGGAPIASAAVANFPRGITVDSSGDVFVATSGVADVYPFPSGACPGVNQNFEYVGGLGATPIKIAYVEQNWGLAIDGTTLYEADVCIPRIFKVLPPYTSGIMPTGIATNEVYYIAISSDHLLTIPNYNGGSPDVIEYDLTGVTSTITITSGLSGPIGAAAGP